MSSFNVGSSPEINRPHPLPTPESVVRPTTPTPTATESTSPSAHAFMKAAPGQAELPTVHTLETEIDDSSPEAMLEMQKSLSAEGLIPEALSEQLDLPPLPAPPTETPRNPWLADIEQAARSRAAAAAPERFDHLVARDLNRLFESENQVAAAHAADQTALGQTTLTSHAVPLAAEVNLADLLQPVGKPVDFKALVAARFGVLEQEARTVIMPGKEAKLIEQARKQAFHLASTARPESDLLFKVATLPPDQLRDQLAHSLSALRSDKYGQGVGYSELSARKKALVDAMIKGFQEGMLQQSYEVHQVLSSRMTESLRTTLAESAPNSDTVFALTLKSKLDIMGELGIKMGLVTPARLKKLAEDEIAFRGDNGRLSDWLDQIPADSRRLIEHLATDLHQVLNRSLPNKPSVRLVDLEGAEGKQVPEQIVLNGKTYTAPKFLGEGGLGLIIKYTDAQSGESVVVKSLLNMEQRSEMVKELQAHRHVMGGSGGSGHENIIAMRGVVRGDNDSLYMVMDLAGGGDLARVSESLGEAVKQGILPWRAQLALAQHLIRDAVAGMQHMQSRNMMHLDVKALNFLLDDNGKVMLSDFGSGQRTGALTADRDYIPTTYYAPEWGGDINQKTDIYQLGRALRSVLGQDAFGTKPVSGQVGTDLAFINAMLADDPAKRPTLTALASSSFVREAEAQDPDKMQTLLRAAVAYSKGAGKEIHALHDELASFQDRLHRAEVALEGTDPIHQPEQLRDRMNQVMRLKREVEGVQERLRLLHARPEIKALTEALNRAAQGLA